MSDEAFAHELPVPVPAPAPVTVTYLIVCAFVNRVAVLNAMIKNTLFIMMIGNDGRGVIS